MGKEEKVVRVSVRVFTESGAERAIAIPIYDEGTEVIFINLKEFFVGSKTKPETRPVDTSTNEKRQEVSKNDVNSVKNDKISKLEEQLETQRRTISRLLDELEKHEK